MTKFYIILKKGLSCACLLLVGTVQGATDEREKKGQELDYLADHFSARKPQGNKNSNIVCASDAEKALHQQRMQHVMQKLEAGEHRDNLFIQKANDHLDECEALQSKHRRALIDNQQILDTIKEAVGAQTQTLKENEKKLETNDQTLKENEKKLNSLSRTLENSNKVVEALLRTDHKMSHQLDQDDQTVKNLLEQCDQKMRILEQEKKEERNQAHNCNNDNEDLLISTDLQSQDSLFEITSHSGKLLGVAVGAAELGWVAWIKSTPRTAKKFMKDLFSTSPKKANQANSRFTR